MSNKKKQIYLDEVVPMYGVNGNQPIAFNDAGDTVNQVTGEKGHMQLPEVVAYGNSKKKTAGDYFKNLLLDYVIKSYVNSQRPENSYKNATRDFNYNADVYKRDTEGGMDNLIRFGNANGIHYQNRLENFGAIKYKGYRGVEKYGFKAEPGQDDYNGWLAWCAANANRINRGLGRPTTGHAWTRAGIYGDSAIVVNPNRVKQKGDQSIIRQYNRYNWDNGNYVKDNIDKHELQTGDMVDISVPGSSFSDRAYREGRGNTHTGTILRIPKRYKTKDGKTEKSKLETFIMHYKGNGIEVEPISKFIGPSIFRSYITGIRRPGTKKHPYKNN